MQTTLRQKPVSSTNSSTQPNSTHPQTGYDVAVKESSTTHFPTDQQLSYSLAKRLEALKLNTESKTPANESSLHGLPQIDPSIGFELPDGENTSVLSEIAASTTLPDAGNGVIEQLQANFATPNFFEAPEDITSFHNLNADTQTLQTPNTTTAAFPSLSQEQLRPEPLTPTSTRIEAGTTQFRPAPIPQLLPELPKAKSSIPAIENIRPAASLPTKAEASIPSDLVPQEPAANKIVSFNRDSSSKLQKQAANSIDTLEIDPRKQVANGIVSFKKGLFNRNANQPVKVGEGLNLDIVA